MIFSILVGSGTLVCFSFGTRRTPYHYDVRRDTSGRRHSNLGVFETSYDAETPDRFFWPRQDSFGFLVQSGIRKWAQRPFSDPLLYRHNVEMPSRSGREISYM